MTRQVVGRIGITVGLLLGVTGWGVAAQRVDPKIAMTVASTNCVWKKLPDGASFYDCTSQLQTMTTLHDSTGLGGGLPKFKISVGKTSCMAVKPGVSSCTTGLRIEIAPKASNEVGAAQSPKKDVAAH